MATESPPISPPPRRPSGSLVGRAFLAALILSAGSSVFLAWASRRLAARVDGLEERVARIDEKASRPPALPAELAALVGQMASPTGGDGGPKHPVKQTPFRFRSLA